MKEYGAWQTNERRRKGKNQHRNRLGINCGEMKIGRNTSEHSDAVNLVKSRRMGRTRLRAEWSHALGG